MQSISESTCPEGTVSGDLVTAQALSMSSNPLTTTQPQQLVDLSRAAAFDFCDEILMACCHCLRMTPSPAAPDPGSRTLHSHYSFASHLKHANAHTRIHSHIYSHRNYERERLHQRLVLLLTGRGDNFPQRSAVLGGTSRETVLEKGRV
jgi:hypothetical protein